LVAVKRIAKNTTIWVVSDTLTKILGMALVIYSTRFLGDTGFGKYTFALSFSIIFAMFSDLGLNQLFVRDVARDKSKTGDYLGTMLSLKLLLAVINFSMLYISINLLNYPPDTRMAVYLIGASVIIGSFSNLFRAVAIAHEKMQYDAIPSIIEKIFVLTLSILFFFSGYGLLGLSSAILLGSVIGLCSSIYFLLTRFVRPEIYFNYTRWMSFIREALPFALISITGILYTRIDGVMLSLMKGDAAVGWYGVAFMLIESLMFLPSAFLGALFPVFSNLFTTSHDFLKLAYERSFKYLFMLSMPIVVGITLVADKIILLFGYQFNNSATALQVLAWSLIFLFINLELYNMLAAINKQRICLFCSVIGVVANITLNLILIPPLSYIGAGFATVITNFIVFIVEFYYISRYFYRIKILKIIYKPIIASMIMAIYILYLGNTTILIIIPTAAILYFAALYLIKAFDETDTMLFKQILSKKVQNE
jgi:O-antigen/teichoic acid export membrane protein